MHGTVYICCCQCCFYQRRNLINSNLQKPLKPRSDHIKGKIKYQYHDSDETGNRCIFSCKNLINFLTSDSFFAFFRLYNCLFTQTLNKVKTHICDCSTSVNLTLCFHLLYDMLQHLRLICVQLQLLKNQRISLDCLGCCKTGRNISLRRMILNQVHDRMNTAVYCTVMVTLITEILTQWMFLIFRYM